MLTYTDFGLDLPELLREAGFEPEVHGQVEMVFCGVASSEAYGTLTHLTGSHCFRGTHQ